MTVKRVSPVSRLGWFLLMLLGVMLVVGLYFIKTRASQAKLLVQKLEHTVGQEEASVRMLRAEIAHLENPERLRSLASEHLDLHPVEAGRVLTLQQAVNALPKKIELSPDQNGGDNE
ncbi:MAG: hypothetical protein EX271_09655 [Acidimicrobiales bacterium]|nr:hypothetical protein [Hyphomonadaceae bacterium]RZV40723.1 MAG: hypothetical protein EX271_09655 [Acidimicrobiales bacterium]